MDIWWIALMVFYTQWDIHYKISPCLIDQLYVTKITYLYMHLLVIFLIMNYHGHELFKIDWSSFMPIKNNSWSFINV
jgi:hypothetical protein